MEHEMVRTDWFLFKKQCFMRRLGGRLEEIEIVGLWSCGGCERFNIS